MSLPSSGPISQSQINSVVNSSGASTNISLAGLADTASFTAPDAISDFYGYNPLPDYKEYYYYGVTQKNSSFACSFDTNSQLFFSSSTNPTSSIPQVGDSIFDTADPSIASPITPSSGWYGIANDVNTGATSAVQFNGSTNVIVGFSLCF